MNSQPPPPFCGHTQGILIFEKMCCQSPLYGSKVPYHKCILSVGVYRFLSVKMPLDGCSIPNTCAFIQIQELEHEKDTQTNYFLSENPWVRGWGLTGSRWKRIKICNNSFRLGSEFPCVKIFLSDIPWVLGCQIPLCESNSPCQNALGAPCGRSPSWIPRIDFAVLSVCL